MLKPPSNIRTLRHKSCANCRHLKSTDDDMADPRRISYSYLYCERLGDELPCEIEEIQITICDLHRPKSRKVE